MKRTWLIGLILLLSVFIVSGCATAPITKTSLTERDVTVLKGKWSGTRTVGTTPGGITDLEIFNDTVPLRGRLLIHGSQLKRSATPVVLNFGNGRINNEGNLIITDERNEFEFSLYKTDGKMKLEGKYFLAGFTGTLTLQKE